MHEIQITKFVDIFSAEISNFCLINLKVPIKYISRCIYKLFFGFVREIEQEIFINLFIICMHTYIYSYILNIVKIYNISYMILLLS